MKPAISVVIPAYNCADYLSAAIQSALDQTYPNIEVVVVNDDSPDNTDEVVQPFLDRIVYIKQKNKGLSGARNAGFKACKGQYVCFLDADDLLLREKFERQLAVFEREPDLGIVISGYINVTEDGYTEIGRVEKNWQRDALEKLLNHEVFPPHAPLIRRSILDASSLFPEDIVTAESQEDWQLWLDLALNGAEFSSVPEPLCKYRHRPGSISADSIKHMDGARRVVNWLYQHPKAWLYLSQIERLSAIVEMERVGRAWKAGQIVLAAQDLTAAIDQQSAFWREPHIMFRLFQNSLSLSENNRFLKTKDVEWFENQMVNVLLPKLIDNTTVLDQMQAVTYLAISDMAYSKYDDVLRKRAINLALKHSWRVCISRQGVASLIRGGVGPQIGNALGKILRRLHINK